MAMTWREAIRHQEAMDNPGKDMPDTVTVNRAELRELIEAAKVFATLNNSRSHADRVLKALQPFEGDK